MEPQFKKTDLTFDKYALEVYTSNGMNPVLKSFSRDDLITAFEKMDESAHFHQQNHQFPRDDLITRLAASAGKRSFLVFTHNKYINVLTENIALFHAKHESSMIRCFDRQEYSVNHSLKQILSLLNHQQFFRLNRQYLVNFYAVKEVEHYFARKLLVTLAIPVSDRLIVSKERASSFLQWLDNR